MQGDYMRAVSSGSDMIAGIPEEQSALAERDEAGRIRTGIRWFLGGFGLGIALDFIVTAAQVVTSEYTLRDVPQLLVWNLWWASYVGASSGLIGLIRSRHPGPWIWRRPQFRTRTLMVVVAYLAFLFSAVVSSHRLSIGAMRYSQKAIASAGMAKVFRDFRLKPEADAKLKRENVAQLQAGKIPEGLHPGQVDFLRSLDLDPKVTPEFRKYRRGLIQEGEEQAGVRQKQAMAFLRRLVDYHEQLATKYDRARWRPWLPVEPDPPMPN
jgi:hypothetical protein